MSHSRSSSPTSASDVPRIYRHLIVQKLEEWGSTDRAVVIQRLSFLMPPGYAWHRYLIDHKILRKLDIEDQEDLPQPTNEDFEKAQRSLALWYLRQLRREGRLEEKNGKIALKKESKRASSRSSGRKPSVR